MGYLSDILGGGDYKGQYKVCYAFYDEIIKYPQFDENKHCLKFDKIYESINPDWLDEEKDKIQQCTEVMLEALRDIEKVDPETFKSVIKVLAPLIKKPKDI